MATIGISTRDTRRIFFWKKKKKKGKKGKRKEKRKRMERRRVCVSSRLFAWPLVIQVLRCLLERSNLEIWSVNLSGLLEYPSSRLEETTRCFKRDKRAWKLSSENFILRTRVLVFNSFLKFKRDRAITGKGNFPVIWHPVYDIIYRYFT